jgi:hypothetical protein
MRWADRGWGGASELTTSNREAEGRRPIRASSGPRRARWYAPHIFDSSLARLRRVSIYISDRLVWPSSVPEWLGRSLGLRSTGESLLTGPPVEGRTAVLCDDALRVSGTRVAGDRVARMT